MGFLKIGTPLSWDDVQDVKSLIRLYGILQFVHVYKLNKDRYDENIMFGDEIEYIIIRNDESLKESSALLCASDLIDEMMNLESVIDCQYGSHWTPEYSSFTIEGTPSVPFKLDINSSCFVEDCMRIRRSKLNNVLSAVQGARAITLPCFPNVLLNNSVLMARRITGHESTKKKFDSKGKVEFIENAKIKEKVHNSNNNIHKIINNKNNESKIVNNAFDQNKISSIEMVSYEMDENKSTNFVNSDTVFAKNDEEGEVEEEDENENEQQQQQQQYQSNLQQQYQSNLQQQYQSDLQQQYESDLQQQYESDLQQQYESDLQQQCQSDLQQQCQSDLQQQNVQPKQRQQMIQYVYDDEIENKNKEKDNTPRSCNDYNNVNDSSNTQDIFISSLKKTDSLFECEVFKPEQTNKYSKSALITDMTISPHARYVTLTQNIRKRRGTKIVSFNPIYKDINTEKMDHWKMSLDCNDKRLFKKVKKKLTLDEHLIWNKSMTNKKIIDRKNNNPRDEVLNTSNFTLAMTNKEENNNENSLMDRVLKNSLFANMDDEGDYIYVYNREFIQEYSEKYTRWRVISNSVDCRTEEELSYICKPRYSGISLYISNELPLKRNYYFYNDVDVILDKNVYDKLKKENVDEYLARHIASLFVRDPIVVFEGSYSERDIATIQKKIMELSNDEIKLKVWNKNDSSIKEMNKSNDNNHNNNCHIEYNNKKDINMNKIYLSDNFEFIEDYEEKVLSSHQHFENFQSTNWNSVRFKPPPILDNHFKGPSSIGWRVEFRTPDIQITDFENSCVVTLVMLLSKFILKERLNLYIPMTLLEENLFRASKREALTKEKFYFRKDLSYDTLNNEFEEKSIYDIFFNETNGLFFLCYKYVDELFKEGLLNQSAKNKIDEYIEFVKQRCSGKICTGAMYLRNFILNHPAYEKNSYINSKINYDICKLIADIGKGLIIPQELLGVFVDPYKERIKSDIRQINESQYLKSLAYKYISGEDYTQYLLLNEVLKDDQDYCTCTRRTIYEESMDNTVEFAKKMYELSA
ncbi:gamma-glutamylcysteine synthetase [Plasmodium falciparum RAJ116]|uniref:glutamate--cysteine ligase n=1 Tax=Plasmodium falciparum RAJ116 TaxID=580058 RepID=A0A0L0CWZ3_PLAFA|nr:gamma-glutamylcysteine synthetase [Plasmodium falciparum RAJ116]